MKHASLILLPLLLSASLHAEPFTLARPQIGPTQYAPNDVALGGGPEGFLLAGTASHHPVAIPLATDATPQITHNVGLGLPSASSVGAPLWIGDRWVVAVIPDHNLPNRLVITELDDTASTIGDPHAIEWERFRAGDLAWNGRTILAAGLEGRTTTILRDLSVRVIGPDLQTAGTPTQIAADVTRLAVSGTQEGFLIAWSGGDGGWIQALDDSGTPLSTPVQLSAAADIRNLGIAVSGEYSMVVWTEPAESGWAIRAAHAKTSGSSFTPMILDVVDGSSIPVALVTAREHGFTFS